MLKISDILKKAKKTDHSKEKDSGKPSPSSEQVSEKPDNAVKGEKKILKEPLPLQPAAEEKKEQPLVEEKPVSVQAEDSQEAVDVYKKALTLSKKILTPFPADKQALIKEAEGMVEGLINLFQSRETQLLKLFFSEYFSEQGYLYQHSINVCLLSLRLGMALNYPHARLQQIGMAAFLHDIGMVKYEELIIQPRRFNTSEYSEIKKHPIAGRDLLKQFAQELDLEIFEIIQQEHERIDGSGYPYGLKDKEISDGAKIIGLVDEYEAMVHLRPYRARLGYLEAIKEILKRKKIFDYKCVKVLIDSIGIFPVNALVKLNTREIGIVIRQNIKMPLRPVINITHNVHGKKFSEPKQVDLSANFSVYILDCIIEE